MADYDAYVICTSPRSGSTLLCGLLAATGVAGQPESYFHSPSVESWARGVGLPREAGVPDLDFLRSVFAAVLRAGTGETGMFGLRLQRHSVAFFFEQLALLYPDRDTDIARLRAAFGRVLFIHLTRADKVEQAVSYVRARQSGLWHRAADGTDLERLTPVGEPGYDGAELRARYAEMVRYDQDWEDWFDAMGIAPLRIGYDALAEEPTRFLRVILRELGVDEGAASHVTPGVAKLADETSLEWAKRLREDIRAS